MKYMIAYQLSLIIVISAADIVWLHDNKQLAPSQWKWQLLAFQTEQRPFPWLCEVAQRLFNDP